MRIQSNHPVNNSDGSVGYLHHTPANVIAETKKLLIAREAPRLSIAEVKSLIKKQRAALNPYRLKKHADSLGLSVKSLEAYGVGYHERWNGYSFPMYDGSLNPIGLRVRMPNGKKVCVPGSRNGIFVPEGYEAKSLAACPGLPDPYPLLLLLPEGPTDAAAAFDLGFRAIGRPSNQGGGEFIKQLLSRGDKQEVVIIADADPTKYSPAGVPFWPGWEGALSLAEIIFPVCGTLNVCKPPEKAKDLREWIQKKDLLGLIQVLRDHVIAEPVNAEWIRAKKNEVDMWRKGMTKSPERKAG